MEVFKVGSWIRIGLADKLLVMGNAFQYFFLTLFLEGSSLLGEQQHQCADESVLSLMVDHNPGTCRECSSEISFQKKEKTSTWSSIGSAIRSRSSSLKSKFGRKVN